MSPTQKRKRSQAPGLDDDQNEPKRLSAACTACRKQKIKCELVNEEPPCTRCERRGLLCVLHTAQRHHNADHKQVGLLGKDVVNIHSSLERICHHLGLQSPQPLFSNKESTESGRPVAAANEYSGMDDAWDLSPPASPSTAQAPIDNYLTSHQDSVLDVHSSRRRKRRGSGCGDLISKGLISSDDAERLVRRYLLHLDRFLYGMVSHFQDLAQVRCASPALLAAMCVVSAFHEAESKELFEVCNREYRSLIQASLFEKRDIEFIRALCIGSFWLPDASRISSSEAIRRAADNRLHQYFHRLKDALANTTPASSSDPEVARDKVRLWYLLYINDQHLSILHNRDCSLRQEKDAIEDRDVFLTDPSTGSNQDVRIISQVSLLVIMSQIRDTFGSERSEPVSRKLSVQLAHFERELDQWYTRWSAVFEPDEHIGAFPLAGLTMHWQFAKLYLGHHVFRGRHSDPIPTHFLPAAIAAREAALTIFTMIVENEAFRSHIVGMPAYFHIMISFAGHFLLEVCLKYREQLNVNIEEDFRKISAALAVFAGTATLPQHPIARVMSGLMKRLQECTRSLGMNPVLTESPAGIADFATSAANLNGATALPATFDLQLANGLPDDLLYADFGDFSFIDSQFQDFL